MKSAYGYFAPWAFLSWQENDLVVYKMVMLEMRLFPAVSGSVMLRYAVEKGWNSRHSQQEAEYKFL